MRRHAHYPKQRFLSPRRRSNFRARRTARLRLEKLEERVPLAADLAVTNAYLVDLDANPISAVVEGERALVRVNYTTTDLTSATQYVIHFELDGVPIESQVITGMPGTSLQYYHFHYAGYSSPGTRRVRVIVDGANQVAETDESNNTFAFNFTPVKPNLPQKFILPVSGVPSVDWTILNHHDVDLRIGFREDFSGGFLQYEGHAGWDIFVANFDQMDNGVPVRAAAGGVVIEMGDGSFDRENFWDFTLPDPRIANYVIVDHGGGWQTAYYHLQRDTVAVEVGQQVVAGQTLGLIGSSGITDGPHVHFVVQRNGVPVEPMYAVADYFVDPPPYLGNRVPKATASGITDRHPIADFKELPNDVRQFELNGTVNPWLWYRLEYVKSGDLISTEWWQPDGLLYARFDWTAPEDVRYLPFWTWTDAIHSPGQWTVVSYHGAVELARESFLVTSAGGAPEIDLRQEDIHVIDGRSTPIDFGSRAQGTVQPEKVFTISNIGTATLSLSDLHLPKGFELIGSFPTAIARGASQTFRVRMLTADIDHHWGDIHFSTNDADESLFRFSLEGTVTGNRNPNAPVITGPSSALAIEAGLATGRVFPALTITDSDNTSFDDARLIANIASGSDDAAADRLILLPISPDIQIHQDTVLYQGLPIASVVKDGTLGEIELLFTAEVSSQIVEQVARSIAFWQRQLDTTSRRRTVEIQLVDPAGLRSNTFRRAVFYADADFNHPPFIESLPDRSLDEDTQLGPVAVPIDDLNHSVQGLIVQATSSNQDLVPTANINTRFSNGQWFFDATPMNNAFGTAVITFVATDHEGIQTRRSFDLTVNSINDLPTVSSVPDQAMEKGNSVPPASFQIDDVETLANDLLLVGTSSNPALIDSSGIAFGGEGMNRIITLTPKPSQIGQATITVMVLDADGGTKSTEFQFTVTPESQKPTITAIADQQTLEDEPFTVAISVEDNETPSEEITLTVASDSDLFPPSNFEFAGEGAERTLKLTPAADRDGQANIVVSAIDNAGNVALTTFAVTVSPVNDFPTFQMQGQALASEDAPAQTLAVDAISAGGGESQPLRFEVLASEPSMFDILEVNYTVGQSTGEIIWKPAPNVSGITTLVATATDGGLDGNLDSTADNGRSTWTVTVDLAAVNDPPTLDIPQLQLVDEDSDQQVATLAGITAGGDETQTLKLTASTSDPFLFEQLSLEYSSGEPTASLSWKPAANVWGDVDVLLELEDAGLDGLLETTNDNGVTTVTLSVTVAPINDPPAFQIKAPITQPEDSAAITETLFNITSGPGENDPLSWSIETSPADGLEAVSVVPGAQAADAHLRWKPSADFSGSIRLILSLTDAGTDANLETIADNLTVTQTLSLTVLPVNDAPDALTLPTGTFPEDAVRGVAGPVVVTDRDPDDTHTVTTDDARFAVINGELTLLDGARLDFETEPTIVVSVTATDSAGNFIVKQTTIAIMDANDPPTALTIEDYVLYEELLGQSIGRLTVTDQDSNQTHLIVSLDDRFEVLEGVLRLKPDTSIATSDGATIRVQLRVSDSGQSPIAEDFELELQTTAVDSPWRNQATKFDVNADTIISPIDVLLVINYLNRGGNSALSAVNNPPRVGGPYFDVNGDRFVSPMDPLLIINWLNNVSGEGEFLIPMPGRPNEHSRPERSLAMFDFASKVNDEQEKEATSNFYKDLGINRPPNEAFGVRGAAVKYSALCTTTRTRVMRDSSPTELSSIDEVFAQMSE